MLMFGIIVMRERTPGCGHLAPPVLETYRDRSERSVVKMLKIHKLILKKMTDFE